MSLVKHILQAPNFKKAVKKLHPNQKKDLDEAVKCLIQNPELGIKKKGDLSYLRVYKFKMVKQETLLGYSYQEEQLVLELLALGSHENFYRDVKP
ncbi:MULTISPECIES: type II toxin-antitoxin system RelE/ParE family toxin [Thiomicrorhabdus]|uniref:Type II toxin-antitoxin system RelE/ParE family toxin n=1 Tax=Thiomicrorhabdus heinhorstiae TaxID=2748010 RepID=A0ABS0BV92_9GAMM|nr:MULTISPECIES: type II toxin-antitoxin system RelE/ParE family toxin [Thiomicrorhabdus]MBF6057750.1 type II toxin-antitoxin system RelE/ParE family toxin [Thiomicrorhabdus heinhorstiae]